MKKILMFLVLFLNLFPLGFNFEKGKMLFPGSLYGQYQGVEGDCINGYMTCDCDGWIIFLECPAPGTIDCQCIDPVTITPLPDFSCQICGQDPCICFNYDPCNPGAPDYSECACLGTNCEPGPCDPSSPYYDECACLGLNCDPGDGGTPDPDQNCDCDSFGHCNICGKLLTATEGCQCGLVCLGHPTQCECCSDPNCPGCCLPCPGSSGSISKEKCNPCRKVVDKLSRSNIASLLVVLEEKAISGGNEWGAEIRIKFQDWEDLAYFTNPGEQVVDLLREGNVDGHSFSPSVINTSDWRAFIGYLHSHPTDGTCFSPADALLFTIFCDQVFDRVQRFENAIGVVVTPSESYALTITDPDSLCLLKGRDDEIRQMFIEGIQDGTYLSQEHAFMAIFGNSIKLIKLKGDGLIQPIELINNNIVNGDCN